jgi:hypothetical protein
LDKPRTRGSNGFNFVFRKNKVRIIQIVFVYLHKLRGGTG